MANKNQRSRNRKPSQSRGSSKPKRDDVPESSEDSRQSEDRFHPRARRGDSSKTNKNGCNDPRWYGYTPQLVQDFASFPYGVASGTRLNTGDPDTDNYSVPGIMNVRFVPSVGFADDENAPINIAMRQVFSFVRKKNSGATNYQPADLIKYIISVDSAYMFLAWMRRAYGLLMDYSQVNRYFPEAILRSMGLDPNDLATHMADFRGFINIYAAKLSSMAIPATMPYMLRHTWMVTNIFADSENEKAQIYFYDPDAYYHFVEGVGAQTQSSVTLMQPPTRIDGNDNTVGYPDYNGGCSLDQLRAFGWTLLNPILASSSMNVMSGDILKAFEGNVVQAIGVTDDYRVLPVYNQEVLSQIMNATMMGNINLLSFTLIEQQGVNEGWIKSTPTGKPYSTRVIPNAGQTITATGAAAQALRLFMTAVQSQTGSNGGNINAPYVANRYITFNRGHITADDTMVATRCTNTYDKLNVNVYESNGDVVGELVGNILTAGSEVCTFASVFQYTWINGTNRKLSMRSLDVGCVTTLIGADTTTVDGANSTLNAIRLMTYDLVQLEAFDWHPPVMPTWLLVNFKDVPVDTGTGKVSAPDSTRVTVREPSGIFVDMGNYTCLTQRNLQDLSAVALLSEFYVPAVGTMNIGLA